MRAAALAIAALAAVAAPTAGCGSKERAPAPPPSTADDPWARTTDARSPEDLLAAWRANLDTLASELPRRHPAPFARTSEAAFRAAVDDLARALPTLTDDQRIVGLARIVALIGDGHTVLDPGGRRAEVYPLALGWFTDGVVVVDADDAHRDAIGARVVEVGGRPIDEAIAVLSSTFGWEAEGQRRNEVPWRMVWPLFLRGSGLAPADGPARFTVVDEAGARHELALAPARWWPTAPPADAVPLYRQRPKAFYWSRWLDQERALYVQYNRCVEAPDLSFAAFTRSIVALLDQHPDARLIVDLRWNGGGNSLVMRPLLEAIAARPAVGERLFALIGRATFSSGLLNAIELDQAGAILVGEPAGAPASHYGEVKRFDLPAFGLAVQHSTRRFEIAGYDGPALAPEVTVEVSSADWFAGRDPVLAAALARPLPSR